MKKILYIVMLSGILVSCWNNLVEEDNSTKEDITTGLESTISDEGVQWVVQGGASNSQFDLDSGINFNQ